MAIVARSVHWDENLGACVKCGIPQIPCPKCLATSDPDVEFVVDETAMSVLQADNAVGIPTTLLDLVPTGFQNPTFVKAYD